ncbi:MAG: alcohol dehydrogenase catalytic domain-containing protein [Dehalococcoidia bacterium]|nr:MAG: alcohol dehydrogenase catalytic domain-containing protein [Dehalococcoidia bacterium]
MKALVYRGQEGLVMEEVDDPQPAPGEVLMKVRYCGICGSDVHLFAMGIFFLGTTPGHEVSAEVLSVGPDVSGWQPGDRVVVKHRNCGQCEYCLAGRPQLCLQPEGFGRGIRRGAFAELLVSHHSTLLRVPPGLDMAHAALAEPLAVAVHAANVSGIEAGQAAVVTGAGPIGLLIIDVLRDRGVQPIIVSEPVERRRALAAKLGPDHVVDPSTANLADLVRSETDLGAHVVFECTGVPEAANAALGFLRPAGTMLVVGHSEKSYTLSSLMVMARELRIEGVFGSGGQFPAALDLLAAGKIHCQDIITRIAPLAETEAWLRELNDAPSDGKVLIDPWAA